MIPICIHRSLRESEVQGKPDSDLTAIFKHADKLLMIGHCVILHAITEYLAGAYKGASMHELNTLRMHLRSRQTTISR